MPLIHSGTKADIGRNIAEMVRAGHSHSSAIAAALDTARRFGEKRAAGGSAGAPSAPTVPTYQTAASGVLPSGLMSVPQGGSYGLDLTTGALTPATQSALQAYAQRGLPIAGSSPTTAPAAAIPTASPLDPFASDLGDNQGNMKRGGAMADGGAPSSSEAAPWFTRSEERGIAPAGLVHTAGAGRTDNVPMSVAAGSHVIPADVVAGIGQGNTLAGAHALGVAMKTGPGGISLPKGPAKSTIPHPPPLPRARGGKAITEWEGHPIKIAAGDVPEQRGGIKCIVAGGEWIMAPDEVQRTRHGGKSGHDAVDAWILERRKADVHKLKNLPGPVKSR